MKVDITNLVAPHPDLQVALAYDFGNAGRAPPSPSWLGVYGSYWNVSGRC